MLFCWWWEKKHRLPAKKSSSLLQLDFFESNREEIVADWDRRLAHTPEGNQARLLETLVVPPQLMKPLRLKGKTR